MGVDIQAPSSGVSLRAKRAGPENVSQPRDLLIVASSRSRSKRPRGASQGQSGTREVQPFGAKWARNRLTTRPRSERKGSTGCAVSMRLGVQPSRHHLSLWRLARRLAMSADFAVLVEDLPESSPHAGDDAATLGECGERALPPFAPPQS